jgi:hypothetical protein
MYGRLCSIAAQAAGGQTIDLSELRCRFEIKQHSELGPDKATIKITNENPQTAMLFTQNNAEFSTITISCGYQDEGTLGALFSGNIVQAFYGRDTPTDTLTTIQATAGHQAHNYAVVSKTLAVGSTPMDHLNVAVQAMQQYGLQLGFIGPSVDLTTPKYPRAVTLYGMARDILFNIARLKKAQISYKLGQIQILGQTDNLPGGAIVLNSTTGMIGMPTQEIGGIMVRSLINPAIKVGGQIQINQADIQQQLQPTSTTGALTPFTGGPDYAQIATDGLYTVFRIDVEGDTRGMPWYMDIAALRSGQLPSSPTHAALFSQPSAQGSLL